MRAREVVAAFVEVHRTLHAVPPCDPVAEQCGGGDCERQRPAVVAFGFRQRSVRIGRASPHGAQHFGRGMFRLRAVAPVSDEQRADAVAFEVVVGVAPFGAEKELRAGVGPYGAVVVERAGRRTAFRDVEPQQQIGARVEDAEPDLRGIGEIGRPVVAGDRFAHGACEGLFERCGTCDVAVDAGDAIHDFRFCWLKIRKKSET